MVTRALFASSRDALAFALNYEDLSIPGPVMNKEMAAVPTTTKAQRDAVSKPSRTGPARSIPLGGGQDRAVTAGWILQRFEQAEKWHKVILKVMLINPRRQCSCGAACCRGWSVKPEWVHCVLMLVEHLKEEADLLKEPGKRGMSTDPALRRALVEDFARPEDKRWSIADLARLTKATTLTVAKHRGIVQCFLYALELAAWEEVNLIFDQSGITGQID